MKKHTIIWSFLITALAAACTLTPRDTGKAFMFSLSPLRIIQQGPQSETLVVAMPVTSPELDTYRIALKRDDGRWDYYAGARWAEFLPLIVQDSLTKTLEHARMYKAVAPDQTGLMGDKILKTEIRTFQAEYTPGSIIPVVKVQMVVSVLTRVERNCLASFSVSADKKAGGHDLPAIQRAFTAAFNEAQRQLIEQLGKK